MKTNVKNLKEMLRAFGREMAAQRRRCGLTQGALAERTGLSVNTIGNVERGALDPTVTVVALMQVHLGCPGLELRGGKFIPLASPLPAGPIPFPNLARPPADIAVTVGNTIRDRRQKRGLTMEDLTADSGVHLNTLWNVEHGLVAPTISTLYRIYRSLGVRRVVGTPSGIELLP
jgi:transcriptional regulator with XRE-family HTH domain